MKGDCNDSKFVDKKGVLSNKGSLARKSSDKNGAFQNDEGATIFILHRKI